MAGSNYTINTQCKHLMPCGWCELKNEICSNYLPIYPHTYDPNMVCVYAAPSGAPIVTYESCEEDEDWYTELDDPKIAERIDGEKL